MDQIRKVVDDLAKIGTIEWVYFEGGEPFLFYPLMLEGVKVAHDAGFKTGIVTNGYWATSEEDAELWLRPLRELGVSDLSISDDSFHYEDEKDNPAKRALTAAKRLEMPASTICIEKPKIEVNTNVKQPQIIPVISGRIMFRGRAVEKLTERLPSSWWGNFTECPYEDLKDPKRVHIDSYGYVHLCQGLIMGNIWETPLSKLIKSYNADFHPISGPLAKGGPSSLIQAYNVKHDDKYVDACHLCYLIRRTLLDKFPEYLAPKQVYGLR